LKFDIGFRWERINADIRRERTATFVTDATTPNLSTALRDVVWGNDTFLTAKRHTSEWALAAGALYRLTSNVNLYANASRGYFFPEPRAVTFNALGQPQSYTAEIIKQGEVGVKFNAGAISGTAAAFYNKLTNRRQILFVNGPGGTLVETVNLVGTEAYGGSGTLRFEIMPNLAAEGNVTLQHARYKAFDTTPANVGHKIERQPSLLYNAGLYYDDDRFDASIFTNYTGDVYTASANTIKLKGFNVVNLDAGVKFGIIGRKVRFGVNVFNLLNTDATTEGSPRQDNNHTTGGQFFVGRPVLPRRIAVRLTVDF
jgi:outer membrane receptor for Fe3+-dicitrate